jgi:Holliday junction resolvase-like predicted endonuclease
MILSQTKVVDYTVKWLEDNGWEIIFVHYPEGHHISPEYGELKPIKRKFVDIIAKKGNCLLLIQCNKRFKASYYEKLRKITKEDVTGIQFDILLRAVAFNVIGSNEEIHTITQDGGLVFEVKGEDNIKLYGKIPIECGEEK